MHRLLLITDFFPPEPGGLESFFSLVANQWSPNKITIIVTTKKKNYISSKKLINEYTSKSRFPIYRPQIKQSAICLIQKNNKLRLGINKIITSFAPNYIIFSSISLTSYVISREIVSLGIPYGILLHGGNVTHHPNINKLNIFNFFYKRFLKDCHTIFALSWFIARTGIKQRIATKKVCVLPPSFSPRPAWQKKQSAEIPKWLASRISRKKILLSVGPLVARKGLEKAIKVMSLLSKKHLNLHYVIVGSGPELSYLQECSRVLKLDIEKKVSFTGFIDDALLAKLFQRAYIFFQPGSIRDDEVEAFGTVFMEASWFGLPIVAGKVGGIEEVVLNQLTGLITEHDNNNKMLSCINLLLNSEELHSKLKQSAQLFARQKLLNKDIRIIIQKQFETNAKIVTKE